MSDERRTKDVQEQNKRELAAEDNEEDGHAESSLQKIYRTSAAPAQARPGCSNWTDQTSAKQVDEDSSPRARYVCLCLGVCVLKFLLGMCNVFRNVSFASDSTL